MRVLFQSFLMVFLAEMGDKSQFLMAAMTARYRMRHILIGSFLAITVLNIMAVVLGGLLGTYVPTWVVSLAAGTGFFLFARAGLKTSDHEAESSPKVGKRAIPTVFLAYFLSELGDKTQLTTVALAAETRTQTARLSVLAGTCLGLFLAGLLGILVGILLGKRLPQGVFAAISSSLFFICGIIRLLNGFETVFSALPLALLWSILATLTVTFAFLILCIIERKRNGKTNASGNQSLSKQRQQ